MIHLDINRLLYTHVKINSAIYLWFEHFTVQYLIPGNFSHCDQMTWYKRPTFFQCRNRKAWKNMALIIYCWIMNCSQDIISPFHGPGIQEQFSCVVLTQDLSLSCNQDLAWAASIWRLERSSRIHYSDGSCTRLLAGALSFLSCGPFLWWASSPQRKSFTRERMTKKEEIEHF